MQVSAVRYATPEQIESRLSFAGKEKKQEAAKQNYTMYKDHFVRNSAIAAGTGAAIAGIATKKPLFALLSGLSLTINYWTYKTLVDHFRREGKGENDHLVKNLAISAGLGAVALAALSKIQKNSMKLGALMGVFAGIGLYLVAKTPYDQITKK